MRSITRVVIILTTLIHYSGAASSQDAAPNPSGLTNFPFAVFDKINKKINGLEAKIMERTEKTLQRMKKQEAKLKRKLKRKDSAAAKSVFEDSPNRYDEYIQRLRTNTLSDPRKVGEYMPHFDSLKTMLGYIGSDKINLPSLAVGGKAQQALAAMTGVQNKLRYVTELRQYLKNRKNFLSSVLGGKDLTGSLKNFSKDVYYYGQYVEEYKNVLNDPSKMEKLAINMLNKVPAFRDFVKKNSFLASIFAPNDMLLAGGPDMVIPGLQTRDQVGQLVNTNITAAGSNSQDFLSSRLGDIKQELDNLKGKISSWDDNAELPAFKPNEMKSKSFLKKLEFGTNLQFGRSNNLLPSTADIAGQVAYKFHQNGSFGVGASYKMGFGSLRNISISHQGIGLRSFLDYKLKGSFFVNGGFEYNYNAAFKNIEQLRDVSAWQSSALMGLSKKYKVSKKLKGNIVVLYDFLHKVHAPETQPFVFRFGYNF